MRNRLEPRQWENTATPLGSFHLGSRQDQDRYRRSRRSQYGLERICGNSFSAGPFGDYRKKHDGKERCFRSQLFLGALRKVGEGTSELPVVAIAIFSGSLKIA